MSLLKGAYLASLAAFLVYAFTPQVKAFALKIGAMDSPDARKVHRNIMPRLGGLAIFLGFVISVLLTGIFDRQVQGLLLGATVILLVGILDDTRGLSPRVKLVGQVLASLVLIAFGIRVEFLTNPFDSMIILGKLSVPVTVIWLVGITNAINLIDGLDGLAAGTAMVAAGTIAVISALEGQALVAILALILAGSVLGFLRYNFHPAQIFMGDSGSMFLGFTLSALAIMGLTKGATVISLLTPLVILGIPILDTLFAIVRRFNSKQPIFQPDKGHLHHCLLATGLSHRQTVLVIYALDIILGFSAVLLTKLTTDQSTLLLVGLSLLVILAANKLGVLTVKQAGAQSNVGKAASKDGNYLGM